MYLIKADDELDVQNLLDNAEFTYSDVRVSIPRFKVEYGAPLDEALQALGVRTAYEPEKADLTAMLDPSELPARQHFLDTVVHKTYVAVDEKGTEAAAVTAAMDGAGAALPSRPNWCARSPRMSRSGLLSVITQMARFCLPAAMKRRING